MAHVFGSEFQQRLWRFVRRRTAADADADDVVQEVLLRLWQRRQDVADEAVPAWLFQVARTAIADLYRARGRAPTPLDDGFDAPAPAPGAPNVRELAQCLVPLLDELPAADAEALRRVDLEGGAQTDLARSLALSNAGAKSRVQRARQRLRRAVLDCCRVELDRRGLPLADFECRRCDPGSC